MVPSAHTHKYIELYSKIRDDILLKIYPPNTLLPTENELMEKYQAGRNTVRRALSMLQDEGYITTRRGSGSLISPGFPTNSISNNPPHERYTKFSIELHHPADALHVSQGVVSFVVPPIEVSKAFNIPADTPVYRVQRVWSMDKVHPYNYMIQYMNTAIMPGLEKYLENPSMVYHVMDEKWNLHFLHGYEHITCCNADLVEAKMLDVEVGTALMLTSRIAHCEKGAFEYAIFYGNPKYTGYVAELDGHHAKSLIPDSMLPVK